MAAPKTKTILSFLQGGGEMGELTRNFDWNNNILGSPDHWPQSLRTTLSIILNSKFPMLLWWGDDLIQFYNDAYRPSLGSNGKHPSALGQRGVDCWPEIWPAIKPLIDQVRAGGEAIWRQDQLIPIYRNGAMEDVYWTFSYSPVNDESGEVGGILVVCTETTEKIVTLQRLKESEDELRFAIETTELGVWDYNPTNNKLKGNDRLKDWFGLRPEDEIDLSLIINAVHPADRQRVKEAIEHALQYTSGGLYNIEYTIVNRITQRTRIVRAKGKTTFNDEKIASRFNGTLQDVTEQAISRQKTETISQNLRNIILRAPVAMCILSGPQHIVSIANDRMYALWDKNPEDILNKPLFDVFPEVKTQGFEAIIDHVYNTGESYSAFSIPVTLTKEGELTTIYIDIVYEAFRENGEEISGVMAVAIDVTRQVIDSKKTEEAEERARMAIESAELGLYEIDMDSMRMITDKRLNIIVGNEHTSSRLELIRLIHPDDLPIYEKAVQESLRSGLLKYEIRIIRKDKSVRWIKATGKLTYNKDGKPMKILGVLQDVSAQKEIEHQKDDFIAMVSHELRTPLTSMRIYSDLLLEKYHLSEDQVSASMLRKFNYQVKRLSYIIQDLVDVTRIEANKILLRKTNFELGELVKEIVSEVQIIKRIHQIVIDRCDNAMVYADRERTSQVITNLLNNAIKYSPGAKQVIVRVEAKEDEVICSVTDFGYGIDKEEQTKIFDRFYQVSNVNTRNTGFGLGLYISAEIIKRQNGKLWVESEPGKGATFYFSLQLHQ